MTLKELYEGVPINCRLKVISGRTGRVLAHDYRISKKKEQLGSKEVLNMWAELEVTDSGFGNYCKPLIACYVSEKWWDDEK